MHGGHLSFFKHGTEATCSACDLQSLRGGNGVHLFLPLLIHAGLHQGVKYYSPDAPGKDGNRVRFVYEARKLTFQQNNSLTCMKYQKWKKKKCDGIKLKIGQYKLTVQEPGNTVIPRCIAAHLSRPRYIAEFL